MGRRRKPVGGHCKAQVQQQPRVSSGAGRCGQVQAGALGHCGSGSGSGSTGRSGLSGLQSAASTSSAPAWKTLQPTGLQGPEQQNPTVPSKL